LYTAGAVNKRFEYMALGVPQIANTGPGMSEVIEDSGAGVLVDCEDPASIGEKICSLLSNPEWRRRIALNARQAHLEKYCYEVQFGPVLERLETLTSKATAT
jgi:glycosyltransferase involved in cell wall biosynthesis